MRVHFEASSRNSLAHADMDRDRLVGNPGTKSKIQDFVTRPLPRATA